MDEVPFREMGNSVPSHPWPVLLNADDTVEADYSYNLPGGEKCKSSPERDETRGTFKYEPSGWKAKAIRIHIPSSFQALVVLCTGRGRG